jgi:uncharacterized membrane protein YcaP (DUF421 family)
MRRQAPRIAVILVLAVGTATALALLGHAFEPISFVIAVVLWGALFFVLERGRASAKP